MLWPSKRCSFFLLGQLTLSSPSINSLASLLLSRCPSDFLPHQLTPLPLSSSPVAPPTLIWPWEITQHEVKWWRTETSGRKQTCSLISLCPNMAHHGTLPRVATADSWASTLFRQRPDIKVLADLEISGGKSFLGDMVFLVHPFYCWNDL